MAYAKPRLKVVGDEFARRNVAALVAVEPLKNGPKIQKPAIGARPQRVLRNPAMIYIDPDFQRRPSDRGKRLIYDMSEQWDWEAAEIPRIYFDQQRGVEAAYDGQHTLIGAATRADILELPCDLHESIESAQHAARAFSVRNTRRIPPTTFQLYKADLFAGVSWTVAVDEMAKKLNFSVTTNSGHWTDTPDVVASITTMRRIIVQRSRDDLEQIMRTLVGLAIAPIREMHIRAVERLLYDREFADVVKPKTLRQTLRTLNNNLLVGEAIAQAAKAGMPRYQALATIYWRAFQDVHPRAKAGK